jgi:hypothetical protein
MTLDEFKKKVVKANWYDKYLYYFLHSLLIIGGLFVLIDVINDRIKYDKYGTRYLGYFFSVFLIFLGTLGVVLTPNRYKILKIDSPLSIDNKKQVVAQLMSTFNLPYQDRPDSFYKFTCQKGWLNYGYDVYISMDITSIYISVQSKTGGYFGGGIIDFGGTERFRRKIIDLVTNIITNM